MTGAFQSLPMHWMTMTPGINMPALRKLMNSTSTRKPVLCGDWTVRGNGALRSTHVHLLTATTTIAKELPGSGPGLSPTISKVWWNWWEVKMPLSANWILCLPPTPHWRAKRSLRISADWSANMHMEMNQAITWFTCTTTWTAHGELRNW